GGGDGQVRGAFGEVDVVAFGAAGDGRADRGGGGDQHRGGGEPDTRSDVDGVADAGAGEGRVEGGGADEHDGAEAHDEGRPDRGRPPVGEQGRAEGGDEDADGDELAVGVALRFGEPVDDELRADGADERCDAGEHAEDPGDEVDAAGFQLELGVAALAGGHSRAAQDEDQDGEEQQRPERQVGPDVRAEPLHGEPGDDLRQRHGGGGEEPAEAPAARDGGPGGAGREHAAADHRGDDEQEADANEGGAADEVVAELEGVLGPEGRHDEPDGRDGREA